MHLRSRDLRSQISEHRSQSTDHRIQITDLKYHSMTALPTTPEEVTQLLLDWSAGNQAALDKLMPLVYRELRKMAHNYLNRERRGHTLQTTELVHEAYVRL